jgi:hypothetical protein
MVLDGCAPYSKNLGTVRMGTERNKPMPMEIEYVPAPSWWMITLIVAQSIVAASTVLVIVWLVRRSKRS